MRPFGALLSYQEAKEMVDSRIKPVSRVEIVNLDNVSGRVLAENVIASLSIPSFNRSAMDGYAVRAKDTFNSGQFNPKVLKLTGEIHAGDSPKITVKAGECIQIATGAVMPRGADSVVMVEDTEAETGNVKVFKAVYPGANVGLMGADIKEGAAVLRDGMVLDAGKVGVLASQGIKKVKVYQKPKIAVLPSGEEVVAVGRKLRRGQLYDINSHTVASVVQENGAVPVHFEVVGDKAEEIKTTLTEAMGNDLVVISGGSSVGERDLLVDVLKDIGEVLFHGIQVKPGKPTIFAMIGKTPLFGMPGYPTSCLINSYLFLLPAIRTMAHLPPRRGETVEAKISRRIPGSTGRRQFLTVRIEDGEVVPAFKESGAITSIAEADGYIEIAENIDLLEKGETVTVTLF